MKLDLGQANPIQQSPTQGAPRMDLRKIIKLSGIGNDAGQAIVQDYLLPGERVLLATKSVRDAVIFTDRRIIAVDIQGMTGKKQEFMSYPYKKINAFAVETAGVIDLDGELDIWLSSIGQVHFGFSRGVNVATIGQIVGDKVL